MPEENAAFGNAVEVGSLQNVVDAAGLDLGIGTGVSSQSSAKIIRMFGRLPSAAPATEQAAASIPSTQTCSRVSRLAVMEQSFVGTMDVVRGNHRMTPD